MSDAALAAAAAAAVLLHESTTRPVAAQSLLHAVNVRAEVNIVLHRKQAMSHSVDWRPERHFDWQAERGADWSLDTVMAEDRNSPKPETDSDWQIDFGWQTDSDWQIDSD